MQVNVGVDLIETERIKKSIESLGDKFINKIYTDTEIEYCNSKNRMKYQHFAARFAAKEACFKAVSILLKDKYSISWKNAQIINDKSGKPHIELIDLSDEVKEELSLIKSMDVSLSHLEGYAIANVTILV